MKVRQRGQLWEKQLLSRVEGHTMIDVERMKGASRLRCRFQRGLDMLVQLNRTVFCEHVCVFPAVCSSAQCSPTPILPQPCLSSILCFSQSNVPSALCSISPMFPELYVPSVRCSISPMFHQSNVPSAICSISPKFPELYVPIARCSFRPMFHQPHVP